MIGHYWGCDGLKKRKKKVQNSGDSGHYDFWPVAICTNFISFLYHANIMPTFSNAHTHTRLFLWKLGTSHGRNGFYTVGYKLYNLHQPYT